MLAPALALLLVQDPTNEDAKLVKPAPAALALRKLEAAPGLDVSLFATEPLLANPVAMSIDERGRVFVAETYRIKKGALDMRDHGSWLDDDLASRTVADREALLKAKVKGWQAWAARHEQVRLVVDTDGDGVADQSTVFADGFNSVTSGIGAGVLAYRGAVYYACIPDLWRLGEAAGGKAGERKELSTGYGVHVSFFGHDLHGLRLGPDRKLYFSIGDRGLHVETAGGVLDNADCGAVLRCELDGSELEVYATGLRNPQELAFDDLGNLFTGDNNGDGGDKARLVYVMPGGDSGWRIGWQWIGDRGPWNRERLWHLAHADQPAWIVPPIAHLASGPSGFTHYPGTGLPERYADCFFLADFTGTPAKSGVYALRLQPSGAAFELAWLERFVWGVLATDCEFGTDDGLWVLDWVQGWEGSGRGRIHRVRSAKARQDPAVAETRRLLAAPLDGLPSERLTELLAHPDQRVRTEAHFALADLGAPALAPLTRVAADRDRGIARVHAVWGLMLLGKREAGACTALATLLDDADFEIRAQAARALGERRASAAAPKLRERLGDPNARVRSLAAEALGRLADPLATAPLCKALRDSDGRDPFLRHSLTLALARCADRDALLARSGDASVAVRIGIVLALRHQKAPELAGFLGDPEPRVVVEAARAIHDVPIPDALPHLAALVQRPGLHERAVVDRAINAALLGGTRRDLDALLELAGRQGEPEAVRCEALWAIEHFARPERRDRVLATIRALPQRDLRPAQAALAEALERLVQDGSDAVCEAAVRACRALRCGGFTGRLLALAEETQRGSAVRRAALEAVEALGHADYDKALQRMTGDPDAGVRALVLDKLGKRDPPRAVPMLEAVLKTGTLRERQRAYATLGRIEAPAADALLCAELDRLLAGAAELDVALDLLDAAGKHDKSHAVGERVASWNRRADPADPLASYRDVLQGGNRGDGDRLFHGKVETECTRCHEVKGEGGTAGPDLTGVGKRLAREKLLESLLAPSKVLAAGYGTVAFELKDGRVVRGTVARETAGEVDLQLENGGGQLTIEKADVDSRADPVSAMPAAGGLLTKRELRDLIEYLASLRD